MDGLYYAFDLLSLIALLVLFFNGVTALRDKSASKTNKGKKLSLATDQDRPSSASTASGGGPDSRRGTGASGVKVGSARNLKREDLVGEDSRVSVSGECRLMFDCFR